MCRWRAQQPEVVGALTCAATVAVAALYTKEQDAGVGALFKVIIRVPPASTLPAPTEL